MTQVIAKNELLRWLEGLSRERRLVAPVRTDSLTLFQTTGKVEEIALDFTNTTLSPKEWFFPATEALFSLERKDGTVELVPNTVDRETVIFGIRPCDASGLIILDKAFLAAPADAQYQQHRSRAALVGIACTSACPECFCTSMGTAPDDASHVDILLTPTGESYTIQVLTEKGKTLLARATVREAEVAPAKPPAVNRVPTENISEVMKRAFETPYWNRLADRCIHCNLCAYVCPVCYCFDIRDYTARRKVVRVRSWESCQSPGFTRIAGGYDPRPTKGAKLRQRFYHKLLYMSEQLGVVGCTGCGRCVRSCPVNIDIREIITDIQKVGARNVA